MICLKIIDTYSAYYSSHDEWKNEMIKCFFSDKKGPKFGQAYRMDKVRVTSMKFTLLYYSQGRLSNSSLISGGQMQIITQCLLSLPPYSAL